MLIYERGGLLVKIKLVYLDCFESDFKDKKYTIYRFLDPNTLSVLSGTNLNLSFIQYKTYECVVEWKNNKLKVVSAQ